MTRIPCIPSSAPFTPEQRAWLNGYLAGLFADAQVGEEATNPRPQLDSNGAPGEIKPEPLLIMYGSQTGTAEQLAKRLAAEAGQHGCAPQVVELNAFGSIDLKQPRRLLIVTSTWGDGDPPDNAMSFWHHLNSDQAPRLDELEFSVLALGDRHYTDFCGAGKKFDARLEQLGGRRIHPRADCDVDYEAAAKAWMEGLWPALLKPRGSTPHSILAATAGATSLASRTTAPEKNQSEVRPSHSRDGALAAAHTRNQPFPARLLANRTLNAPGSAKETRHFEILLQGSGLNYEAGDALGVMPANCPTLVSEILQTLGCDGEEAVKGPRGEEISLRHALLHHYQITQPSLSFVAAVAERSGDAQWRELLDPARQADLEQYLHGREVIDLLIGFRSVRFAPAEFVGLLRKLQPRLYSISSSPRTHPNEVHLTVATVRYESHGRRRKGVCSTYLADRVEADTPVPVFVQTSHGFRLPPDPCRPMIMIGPGTGIAPFRAFLEERRALGAPGRNWLFFGDQCRATDFLYREEWEAMLAQGTLTRLDTAFSRDQAEKVYVQHRMLENAKEIWRWLEEGAHLYVCGDAKRMAGDVEAALHEIIQRAGGRTAEQAADYARQLKAGKRYQRDVY